MTGHVSDAAITCELEREPDLDAAARNLIDAANDAGGLDNITVMLVRYEKED